MTTKLISLVLLIASVGMAQKANSANITNLGDGGKNAITVGTLTVNALATPGAPTVTPTCTGTCASTWTYTCTALAGDATTTVPGAAASTLANATTLDATHFNTVTCPAVTGASYNTIRRTVSGGTPATLGALTGCTATAYGTACVDNGLVGDASAAPSANTTGRIVSGNSISVSAATDANVAVFNGDQTGTPAQVAVKGLSDSNKQLLFGYSTTGGYGSIQSILQGSGGMPLALNPIGGSVSVGTAYPDRLLHAELADAATNAVSYVSRNSHITSGTATTGFGAGHEDELENASGTNRVASAVETSWTDATDATEDSKITWKTMVAGSLGTGISLSGNNLLWETDSGGSIGLSSSNRPSNIYAYGGVYAGNMVATGWFYWPAKAIMSSPSAGVISLFDAGGVTGAILNAAPGGTVPAWKAYTVLKIVPNGTLASGTYTSGITATGTAGQTCALTAFNGGGAAATATVALTGVDTIAGGTALVVTAAGTGYAPAPTSATAGNGTATCSGTATVATVLAGTCKTTVDGCWTIDSAVVADAAASPGQLVPFFTLPANGAIEDIRIKSAVACVNAAGTATITDVGLTGTAGFYATGLTYDLEAAVSNTNLLFPTLAARGSNTAASTDIGVTVFGDAGTVGAWAAGCSFKVAFKYGVTE